MIIRRLMGDVGVLCLKLGLLKSLMLNETARNAVVIGAFDFVLQHGRGASLTTDGKCGRDRF